MRPIAIILATIALTACSSSPQVFSSTPIPNPPYEGHHYRAPSPGGKQVDAPAAPVPGHDWTMTEDRFITTHNPDVSAEALHIPVDQINDRLGELDKKTP
jgi:hypothetical protein